MRPTPEHLLVKARERFAMQDYRGALFLVGEIIEEGQSFADAYHLEGMSWSMLGHPDRALASFDRALELNPRYIEALIHRGLVLNQLGRVKEAEAALSAARSLPAPPVRGIPAPAAARLANHHADLGEAYAEYGALNEAIEQYQRAVELGPSYHDLRHRLAKLLLESGRVLEARQELESILEAEPRLEEVKATLGLAHYLAGDQDAARAIWLSCRGGRPTDARLTAYLSMVGRS